MQTHHPTTQMATLAAVEADAKAVTRTGDKSPTTVLSGVKMNTSSNTDTLDHFLSGDPSTNESPSDSNAHSATTPHASSRSKTVPLLPPPPRSAAGRPPPPLPGFADGPPLAATMQTHDPTTQMATPTVVEADAKAVTRTGDKSPTTVLSGVKMNTSSSTDTSDHFFSGDPSINESPSYSNTHSATIPPASRQEVEPCNGFSDVRSASLCSDGNYAFKAGMILVSFLLVLSSPILLHHLYSEPLDLLWAIAVFISTQIVFLIFIFSPTMCLSTVFFHMPYLILLATVADRFVGPCVGFLVIYMSTGWLSGVLGYAYAEYLQHIGRETSAKHITPSTFLTEEIAHAAVGFGFLSLLMITVGALPLWFFPMDVLSISVSFLSVLDGGAIFSWVAFIARFVLHDALLSADKLGYIMLCYFCPYVVIGYFVLLLSHFSFTGDTIGATFLWCLMLFIAGLLGYVLSVHAECKKMILLRRAWELRDGFSSAAEESSTAATTSDDKTKIADESSTAATTSDDKTKIADD